MTDQLRPAWAVKAIIVILFWSILFRCVSATNHTVGGSTGWDLASDVKNWASNTVFITGDNLVFVYKPDHDVIEVGERGYAGCQIRNPIRTHNDGNTVIPLTNPGTRYFVCGRLGHCLQGLKVQVDVLPFPQTVSSSPSTEIESGDAAPIGFDDPVEGPDGFSRRHRRPPRPPRHFRPPPPPSHDIPPIILPPPVPDVTPVAPSPNGASAERCGVDLTVAYLVYSYSALLLIKTIAHHYPFL